MPARTPAIWPGLPVFLPIQRTEGARSVLSITFLVRPRLPTAAQITLGTRLRSAQWWCESALCSSFPDGGKGGVDKITRLAWYLWLVRWQFL